MKSSHSKLLQKIQNEIETGMFGTGGDQKQRRNILRIGRPVIVILVFQTIEITQIEWTDMSFSGSCIG